MSERDAPEGTSGQGVRAAVVSVGNELLFGETIDTNAAWLGRELAMRGIGVARRYTVGDDHDAIQEAVLAAAARADFVIVSGGLGPTADDVTRDAVASAFGRELRRDEGLLEALRERFRRRGYGELPATNDSQADVPEGATVLRNAHGTAPGLALEHEGVLIAMLPGVPRELKGLVEGELGDLVRERLGGRAVPVHHRVIHTTGVSESRLAEIIDEATLGSGPLARAAERVTVAYLPDLGGVDLRLTARAKRPGEAEAALDAMEGALGELVGRWCYRSASGDLAEAVGDRLAAAKLTLATAESCTAGLVAKRVTDLPGASSYYLGGLVAYHNEVKVSALGVSPDTLERHGAVSEEVAREMAEGVAQRVGADLGLSVTGIAGPDGGTDEKPVGLVWIAVADAHAVRVKRLHLVGDRSAIRARAAQAALALLLRTIERPASEV